MIMQRKGAISYILFIVLLLIPGLLPGQQKDFQTWWEFNVDKGLDNGIDLSGEIEQRFRNNSLQYDRTLVTVTGEYDVLDYLNLAAGARALLASNREMQLNVRYRMHLDVTGRYSVYGIDLTLRTRLQYGFDDLVSIEEVMQHNLANRNRLKASYHIFGTRIDCFASLESWHRFVRRPERMFNKMRYSAGIQYMLNFRSQLGIRYILEDEFNEADPLQSHILVLDYTYDL